MNDFKYVGGSTLVPYESDEEVEELDLAVSRGRWFGLRRERPLGRLIFKHHNIDKYGCRIYDDNGGYIPRSIRSDEWQRKMEAARIVPEIQARVGRIIFVEQKEKENAMHKR